MALQDSRQWPAQEPPADFADRAVEAMLRAPSVSAHRRIDRRWAFGLAFAATLAAAGAWAAVELTRRPAAPPAPAEPPAPAACANTPQGSAAMIAGPAAIASSAAVPAPNPPVVRPKPSASAASSAAPAPSASAPEIKKVRTPRCECAPMAGFCTCVD